MSNFEFKGVIISVKAATGEFIYFISSYTNISTLSQCLERLEKESVWRQGSIFFKQEGNKICCLQPVGVHAQSPAVTTALLIIYETKSADAKFLSLLET